MIKVYAETINYENAIDSDWRMSFCYLHGKLEKKNGCDLFCVNKETYDFFKEVDLGIFYVTVVFMDRTKTKAKFYFWHDLIGHPHGLVVLPEDEDYAQKKMIERDSII